MMDEVTGNSQLLMGFIAGAVAARSEEAVFSYDVEEVQAKLGQMTLRRRGTENIYRVTVVQIGGEE